MRNTEKHKNQETKFTKNPATPWQTRQQVDPFILLYQVLKDGFLKDYKR